MVVRGRGQTHPPVAGCCLTSSAGVACILDKLNRYDDIHVIILLV